MIFNDNKYLFYDKQRGTLFKCYLMIINIHFKRQTERDAI